MTNPLNPNFKPGVGRLATDRYDFAGHVNGTAFNHLAGQIVVSPAIVIGSATVTDVQTALAVLSGSFVVPTVPQATIGQSTSNLGIITLGGDFSNLSSTALAPRIGSLQNQTLTLTSPSLNQVLQWNGSAWVNAAISPAGIGLLGTVQLATTSSSSTSDIGNTATNVKVIGIQGFPVSNAAPSSGNVLVFSAGTWAPGSASGTPAATSGALGTVQLAGDLNGTGSVATAPRVGSINSATVPAAGALTAGNVLQVQSASALTYGFILDANVGAAAALQGTKINPAFGTQNISTTGTAAFGATTITGALTAGAGTAANTLTGSWIVTTRTVSSSPFTVDSGTTDYILFVNTSSAVTINLPVPTNGRRLVIKDITGLANSNNITLAQHSSEKIEGLAASKPLGSNFGSWTVVSNGTDWFLI
jgi:hypothetical protein